MWALTRDDGSFVDNGLIHLRLPKLFQRRVEAAYWCEDYAPEARIVPVLITPLPRTRRKP